MPRPWTRARRERRTSVSRVFAGLVSRTGPVLRKERERERETALSLKRVASVFPQTPQDGGFLKEKKKNLTRSHSRTLRGK